MRNCTKHGCKEGELGRIQRRDHIQARRTAHDCRAIRPTLSFLAAWLGVEVQGSYTNGLCDCLATALVYLSFARYL